jgi:hypothetical protein
MKQTVDEKIRDALTAEGEELWRLVRDPHPDVPASAVLNRNLSEEMAVSIAKRRNISAETIGFLAGDVRFRSSYRLKNAICRNPRTPQRITFSLLKFLRIFDLADISRDQQIPVEVRRKIEFILAEKIRPMPAGVKIALARRANAATLLVLMAKGDARVVAACLESPVLTEGHLYRLITRAETKPEVIKTISVHPKWSLRYHVKYSLIRNYFTPMSEVLAFIKSMKTADLRELYADPKVPVSTKPFLFSELQERGEPLETGEQEVFDLPEGGETGLPAVDADRGTDHSAS